jgi:hypothetical protein
MLDVLSLQEWLECGAETSWTVEKDDVHVHAVLGEAACEMQ